MKQPVQFRSASAAAKQQPSPSTAPPLPTPPQPAEVSFENDIVPIFEPYQGNMAWRFDLLSYDAVKANAPTIFNMISTQGMPPPPLSPLTAEQIATFAAWMKAGYPP